MSKHLKRVLALVLCVAMLLSIGFVMPVAADDVIELGHLHEDPSNPTAGNTIALIAEGNLPENWAHYYADSADNVRILKSGSDETKSIGALTEYGTTDGIITSRTDGTPNLVINNSQWNINCAGGGTTPLAYGDTLIVGGYFTGAGGSRIHIDTTYITKDADGNTHCSETFETGKLSYSSTEGEYIYFNAEYNPYLATWNNFKAEEAGNVKVFRNGTVYNIGALTEYGTSDGIFVSRNGNLLAFRNSQWNINCSGVSGLTPFAAGDIYYIGGNFSNGTETFHVDPIYFIKDSEGNITEVDGYNVGTLSADSSHAAMTSDGFIYSCSERGYANNWQDYKAENADCVKMRKAGSDSYTSIGEIYLNGCTDGILVKRGDNVFCVKSTQWLLNCAGHSELSPMAEGDVMIVEGNFTGVSDGITVTIEKTYITIKNGALVFSTTEPTDEPEEPDVIEAGLMKTNTGAASLNSGNFYFCMDANDVPYDGWSYEYKPTSADNVKLLRGSYDEADAVSVGLTDKGGCIVKYSDTNYYFKGETGWTIDGTYAPLRAGDIVIVEGNFVREDVTFNVTKSVIVIGEDESISIGTEIPEPPAAPIEAGVMKTNTGAAALNNGNFYFCMDANAVQYNTDWSTEFKPTSADNVKLLRGSYDEADAISVGLTDKGGCIIKYSDTNYYFKGETGWTIDGTYAPLTAGDIVIVEGLFSNGVDTFNVTKSIIVIGEDGSIAIGTELPEPPPAVIEAGAMAAADNTNINNGGFYFTMAANALPYVDGDWNTRFYATSADCVKLTRNGVTTSVGQTTPGRSPIIKYGETAYYFDGGNGWYIGDAAPLTIGDVLCVEGEFTDGTNNFTIEKTYISFNWDGSVSFSATEPSAPVKPFADTQDLTVAVWNGSFHSFGMKQMYDLRMAGINTIIGIEPYWLGSTDTERNNNMSKLLDLASLYGIKVYPKLQTGSGMWDGNSVPGYNTLHAAIAGFLIQDEPSKSQLAHLGDLKEAFDANEAFAGKEFLVNLYPASSSNIHIGGDYADYVDTFISEVNPDTIAVDIYPLNSTGSVRKGFFENLAILADRAQANGCKLQYTMLACAHETTSTKYAVPSADELRWYYDVAMAFGATEFVQYIYTSHESSYTTAFSTEGAISNQDLYNAMTAANTEHAAWADIYAAYDYVGTAAVGSNAMISAFSDYAAALPAGISADGKVLVGIFDNDGQTAYMITNAGTPTFKGSNEFGAFSMSEITVTIAGCTAATVITEGESEVIDAVNGTVTVTVPAYEGVFVIPTACAHENTEIRNAADATCEAAGYTGDTYCTDCNTKIAEGEAIAALGHDLAWDGNVGDGTSHGLVCSRCDYTGTEACNMVEGTCSVCGYEEPVVEVIELGHLHEDPAVPAQTFDGKITLIAEGNLPENWAHYYADSADNVKILKVGSDAFVSIGALTEHGTTDGIITSRTDGTPNLVINNSQWNINCSGASTSPLTNGDTMVVGGYFTGAGGSRIHIDTTYITKDAAGNLHCSETFETGELKNPTTVSDGITFEAEYDCYTDTWSNFKAEEAGNVKLFRNGQVYNIGALTEYGTTDGIFVSRNGNVLFFRNSQWNLNCTGISGLSPLSAGDVLYIGGNFSDGTETFHVAPSYFAKDSEGNITEVGGYNVGTLSADSSHAAMTSDGFIYSTSERGYANDWQDYKAENADCVKLRKAGSDDYVSIGNIYLNGCTDGILVKRGDNVFCIKSTQWLLNCAGHSELSPMAEGDIIVVEGNFTGVSDGITVTIEKSYITMKDGNLVFSTTEPHEHSFVAGETVLPTCEEGGYTVYTCSCGETENRDFVDALGHDLAWDGNVGDGINHVLACSRCDYTENQACNMVEGTCTVCGYTEAPVDPTDPALVFAVKSLSFQDRTCFMLMARYTVLNNYDSYYVEFSRYDYTSGETVVTRDYGTAYNTKQHQFSYGVYSMQMGDQITATLYGVKDGVAYRGEVYTDSVHDYAISKLPSSNDAMRTIYANMLDYGAKAQLNFSYNTANLVNADLGEYASYIKGVPTVESQSATNDNCANDQANLFQTALNMADAVKLQYIISFVTGADANNMYAVATWDRKGETITKRIDSSEFMVSGKRRVIMVDGLTAAEGKTPVTLVMYDATTNQPVSDEFTFSIQSHVYNRQVAAAAGANLDMCNAMMNFYDAVAAIS